MSDPSRPVFPVTSTRIGRTDLGGGAVSVDDDSLVIVLRAAADDQSFRVPLAAIDAITVDGADVVLAINDGTRLTLAPESAAALCDEINAQCRAIPELTRALHSFGSSRGHRSTRKSGPSEQQRFFAPLLDARRVAMAGVSPLAALRAFEATSLATAIASVIRAFAAERHGNDAPARRALEAELEDLTESLRDALAALARDARDAETAADDLQQWRAWSAQLRVTFEIADRAWIAIDGALSSVPWRE